MHAALDTQNMLQQWALVCLHGQLDKKKNNIVLLFEMHKASLLV